MLLNFQKSQSETKIATQLSYEENLSPSKTFITQKMNTYKSDQHSVNQVNLPVSPNNEKCVSCVFSNAKNIDTARDFSESTIMSKTTFVKPIYTLSSKRNHP